LKLRGRHPRRPWRESSQAHQEGPQADEESKSTWAPPPSTTLALCAPIEDAKNMLRKMVAHVMFLDPYDLNRGTAELIEHDFEVEYLDDRIDDYGRAVWVNVWTLSELDDFSFFDWMETIVEPVGGEVCEAGPATQSYPSWVIAASWRQRA
jgi:hypothetical protein